MQTGDLGLVAREIDWVTKYQLIERYRAKHDLPLSSPRVAQPDLAYHDVHRGRGLYYLLQRRGAVQRVCRDIDIFEANPCRRRPRGRGCGASSSGGPRSGGGNYGRLGAPQAQ